MNRVLNILGIVIFIFIGVTGGFIYHMEYIPDNAKVLVIEEYKIWIPNANWADKIFQEQSLIEPNTKRAYEKRIESTYSEVHDGRYRGFDLPESWQRKDGGRARIVWGKEESLLRSWIFPKDERWNQDGSWNW